MKTSCTYPSPITSIEEVEAFFRHLYVDRKMYGFHPDDGFDPSIPKLTKVQYVPKLNIDSYPFKF